MDIKELGICGFVVIGGAIYGVSEYGLGDVLEQDLKTVAEVPMDERATYMQSVTVQFTEFFSGALYGTDNFTFATDLKYEFDPRRAAFIQVSQSHTKITKDEVADLKRYNKDKWMCETDNILLFTGKGWTYTTKLKNMDGRTMVTITCKATSKSNSNNVDLRVG